METIVYECDPHDPPGSVAPALNSAGGTWTVRRLWKGEALMPWRKVRAAVLLGGGPMVWDPPETTPWMAPLIAWTREASTRGQVAVIGICLGHQVLAAALGGRVEEMERARRGIGTPQWTPAGRAEAALSGFVEHGPVMYSHRAAVVEAPPGATTLARSPESKAARIPHRALDRGAVAPGSRQSTNLELGTTERATAVGRPARVGRNGSHDGRGTRAPRGVGQGDHNARERRAGRDAWQGASTR